MKKIIILLFSVALFIINVGIGQENKKAREIGEAELSKYVIKCGDSWYVKRITHGPYELRRDGATYLREKTLSESDKLNGIEYWGVLEFSYIGPRREYGFTSNNTKGWSEWIGETINIDIWIQKRGGSWKAELTNDIFRGASYEMIMCKDVIGLETEIDINNISNIRELEILEKRILNQLTNTENAYNRRIDIAYDLLQTVINLTNSNNDTFDTVKKVLSKAKQVHLDETSANDPIAFSNYRQIQNELSSAVSELLNIIETNTDLVANNDIRDLQIMLEGVENRIMVERMNYNELAKAFNSWRLKLNVGNRFKEKQYFRASGPAPKVSFFP